MTGTIASFHERRGYGFIDGGSGTDIFVHHTNMGPRITTGQRVEYGTRDGRKGLEAYDVVAI